jgi:putative NIF3 family GTP cyclohydrolase 1 type 2
MKAENLYEKLDKDFDIANLTDDWSFMIFSDYMVPAFREKHMGLVLDNAETIKKVYTATIPDLDILDKLLLTNERDILLFSHHAMGYDPTLPGFPFYDIPEAYLSLLKQQRISFYVLHAPLDKNGEFSTSVNLAKHLDLQIIDEFCHYMGIKCGVICQTEKITADELAAYMESRIGHEVKLRKNGKDKIHNGLVAVAAGGGNVDFAAREIAELGINLYVTGCTRQVPSFEPVVEFHRIVEDEQINVIGASHYTTEKYACQAMVDYFENLGIPAEFLEGKYYLEDL